LRCTKIVQDGARELKPQLFLEARDVMLDDAAEGSAEGADIPPTRVFWQKRLQTIENKGRESEKEGKEALSD